MSLLLAPWCPQCSFCLKPSMLGMIEDSGIMLEIFRLSTFVKKFVMIAQSEPRPSTAPRPLCSNICKRFDLLFFVPSPFPLTFVCVTSGFYYMKLTEEKDWRPEESIRKRTRRMKANIMPLTVKTCRCNRTLWRGERQ